MKHYFISICFLIFYIQRMFCGVWKLSYKNHVISHDR